MAGLGGLNHRDHQMKVVTVLLVDGVRARRQPLRALLRGEGYVVYEAGSLRAALQTLRWVTPEVALVDARLPDSSGVAAARTLTEAAEGLQAIVMARPASAESLSAAVDAMVFAAVTRDDDPNTLLGVVRKGVRRHREAARAGTARAGSAGYEPASASAGRRTSLTTLPVKPRPAPPIT